MTRATLLFLLGFLLSGGCASQPRPSVAASVSEPSKPIAASLPGPTVAASASKPANQPVSLPLPVGPVNPPPEGCISLTFYPADAEGPVVKRSEINNLPMDITTAFGRREEMVSPLKWEEIEAALPRNAAATDDAGKYELEHYPEYVGPPFMPTKPTWDFLSKYLRDDDVIWAFGRLDCGIAIERDKHVICVVIVSHAPDL